MAIQRTRAIVLRRTNYLEADRILQLLTPQGQKSVIAKGVRKEKSKLAGGIELFAISDIVMTDGRGKIGTLTSARLVQFFGGIITDYNRLEFGYSVIKHVARASQLVDEPDWYNLVAEVLAGLDKKTIPLRLVQIWWYLRYAELMGDGLNLIIDVNGQKLVSDQRYSYDLSEKGLRPQPQGEISAEHIKYMRIMQQKSLSVILQIGGVGEILPECWSVSRLHAAID